MEWNDHYLIITWLSPLPIPKKGENSPPGWRGKKSKEVKDNSSGHN